MGGLRRCGLLPVGKGPLLPLLALLPPYTAVDVAPVSGMACGGWVAVPVLSVPEGRVGLPSAAAVPRIVRTAWVFPRWMFVCRIACWMARARLLRSSSRVTSCSALAASSTLA